MTRLSWRRSLSVLALLLFVTLVFWPGLSGHFLFDDYPNIVSEERVQAEDLSFSGLIEATKAYGGPLTRPIPTVSFAIDHALWGMDPWHFKLTNVLIHLVNTLLVLALVLKLFRMHGKSGPSRPSMFLAWCLALLWAAHPLQVSTVLYVVQRMEMLSLTFVLGGLLAYLIARSRQLDHQRSWQWLAACAGFFVLALLCKESAVQFPVYTAALELTLLRFNAATPHWQRIWKFGYLGATVVAVVAALVAISHYADPEVFAVRDFSAWERVLTQARLLPTYIGWIVLPQPQNLLFYYDHLEASKGLLQPASTLGGGVFLALLLAAALSLRSRFPLAALGVLWFFASHLITSAPLPLELAFEHRNYFAILGVLLAAGELARRLPFDAAASMRHIAVGALLLGVLSTTIIRSATWGDQLHLAMELVANNPASARASTDLGEQYMHLSDNNPDSPFYSMAVAEFERGAALPNASTIPEQGLILLAALSGLEADQGWWDSVAHKLRSQAIGPQDFTMITGLLAHRYEGLEIDDDRFAETYAILADRLRMPAGQYFAFAEHALAYTDNTELAHEFLEYAVDLTLGEPELIPVMVSRLLEKGYSREAELVVRRAEEHGVTVTIH